MRMKLKKELAVEDNDIHQNSDLYDPEDSPSAETDITEEVFENGNEIHEQNEIIEKNTTKPNRKSIKQELSQESKVKCSYADCNKEFTQFQNMRVHYKVAHEGFALKCDLCGYKSTRTNIMRKHKQNNH